MSPTCLRESSQRRWSLAGPPGTSAIVLGRQDILSKGPEMSVGSDQSF